MEPFANPDLNSTRFSENSTVIQFETWSSDRKVPAIFLLERTHQRRSVWRPQNSAAMNLQVFSSDLTRNCLRVQSASGRNLLANKRGYFVQFPCVLQCRSRCTITLVGVHPLLIPFGPRIGSNNFRSFSWQSAGALVDLLKRFLWLESRWESQVFTKRMAQSELGTFRPELASSRTKRAPSMCAKNFNEITE